MRRAGVAVAAALLVGAISLVGCGREERAEIDLQVEQRAAASRAGLTLERAREIVTEVSQVPGDSVTVMHRSVEGPIATILAAIPAADEMLHDETRSIPSPDGSTREEIEAVDIRWDLQADLPLSVIWSQRMQFAQREPVTQEEAEAVAREMLDRWLPEDAPELDPHPAQRLRAPIYVVNWVGMIEGHLTGDQAVVQVSSVTGLPISFSQRIALQRPSPEEVVVTRDEALEIVREHLRQEGLPAADTIDLVAQLSLSAQVHPEGGPAWLVAVIDAAGRQQRVLPVDGMTGEVLTREAADGARDEDANAGGGGS